MTLRLPDRPAEMLEWRQFLDVRTDTKGPMMNDPLQPYRQPMVTATGIILGFVLNFANAWVKGDSQVPEWLAYVIFGLVLVGVVSLIWVLYRVLRTGLRDEDAAAHHQRTLQLFIVGVSCAVAGAVMDMSSNFFGL